MRLVALSRIVQPELLVFEQVAVIGQKSNAARHFQRAFPFELEIPDGVERVGVIGDQYELERLRELYKLDENYSDYKKIGAHIISNSGSNWFSDFTIDKGSKDGIKKNCNVLAGSGLVGIVTEVGPHYARVRSIIDDESNISAMLLSTSDTCVVRGDLKQMENGRIRFEKLANNDNKIEVGEQVVTSHVSDRFLQGLFIGYVSDVKVDSNNLTRSGYITPAVDFSKLHEVLVITTTKSELIKQESGSTKGE